MSNLQTTKHAEKNLKKNLDMEGKVYNILRGIQDNIMMFISLGRIYLIIHKESTHTKNGKW